MTREHYLDRLKARRRSIFEEFQVAYQSTEGVPAGWICPLTEGSVALCHAFVKSYRYEDAGVLEEYVCMDGVVEDPDVREMLRRIADAPAPLHWPALELDRSLLMRDLAQEILDAPPSGTPAA